MALASILERIYAWYLHVSSADRRATWLTVLMLRSPRFFVDVNREFMKRTKAKPLMRCIYASRLGKVVKSRRKLSKERTASRSVRYIASCRPSGSHRKGLTTDSLMIRSPWPKDQTSNAGDAVRTTGYS